MNTALRLLLAACRTIDSLTGCLVACIDRTYDPARTAILFTADHGGIGTGHGGKTMSEMLVPYILVAPGIPAGSRFDREVMRYDNAPDRRRAARPRCARPLARKVGAAPPPVGTAPLNSVSRRHRNPERQVLPFCTASLNSVSRP